MGQRGAAAVKVAPGNAAPTGALSRHRAGTGPMTDRSRDILGEDRFAGSSLRMAAMSLLLGQRLQRPDRHGREAAARERVGHDLTALLDGVLGGRGEHAPAGIGGLVAGVEGLVHRLREHGLGREVESWMGAGSNLPVTARQLAPVFDPHDVDRHAADAGTDGDSLLTEVALVLPDLLHRITPDGRLPRDAEALRRLLPDALGDRA